MIGFILIVLAGLPLPCRAQEEHSAAQLQTVIDQLWTSQEGAPDNIIATAQTTDGFLWLGGMSGLFRFDGVHFARFQPADGNHLLSTSVYSLFAPPTGGLWVGYTFGGFSFIENGHVQNYGGANAAAMGSTGMFAQDGSGPLWANTSTGMWRFDGTKWEHPGPSWKAPAHAVVDMRFDRHGVLWVLDHVTGFYEATTLTCLKPGAKSFELVDDQLSDRFTLDADLKVITAPGISRPTSRKIPGIVEYPVLRRGETQFLDRFGGLWVFPDASSKPMRRAVAPSVFENSQTSTKSPQFEIYPSIVDAYRALNDREGDLWFVTPSGLHKFSFSPLQQLPEPTTVFYPRIVAGDRGGVWIATVKHNFRFCETFGRQFRNCLPLQSTAFPISAGYRATDGSLWIASIDGVWHYARNRLQRIALPLDSHSGGLYVQDFAEDTKGEMWVSFGRQGLYRYAAGGWKRNGGHPELAALPLTEFTDLSGRVWFGCLNNRLAVLDGGHVQVFAARDGLHIGNILAIDERGPEIWIGGQQGIQWLEDGHIHDVSAVNQSWLEGISGIVVTSDGDLWVNGLTGITHFRSREVAAAVADPAHKMTGQHYGEFEGAPGSANQVRPLHTAIQGTDGRIWFSGSRGVCWIDPGAPVNLLVPPPVSITAVVADRKSYELDRPLTLPAGTSDVRISFAGISLTDPAAIRFRYKLQETDDTWHESDAATPVTYQNLSPGTYHFSANSTDTSGVWTGNVATQVFTILPLWYQTGWFRLLWIVCICLLLIVFYRIRVRVIARAMSARFDERLDERTRMARELHDTFLQTVQGSKIVADDALASGTNEDRMRRALEKLSSWLGQAVSEGRTALHALRVSTTEQNELAEFLRRTLQEECRDPALSVAVMVIGNARKLHPIVRDEVSLIAREAIHNACLHSRASQLRVELRYADDLRLCFKDNGIGIDPVVLDAGKSGHFGLQGMKERSARIRATISIVSSRNSGTEVILRVPGDAAYLHERRTLIDRLVAFCRTRLWRGRPGTTATEHEKQPDSER